LSKCSFNDSFGSIKVLYDATSVYFYGFQIF